MKTVWITGASSGIGESLVYAYADKGWQIIISSRNEDELNRVKTASKSPESIKILLIDLADTSTLSSKTHEAWAIFGQIDLLINCGGISQRSLMLETESHVEQQIMNINFWGTVGISKAILPLMIKNNGGQIVIISSLVGKFGTRLRSAYAASKHALHGYFDSVRAELTNPNLHISIVCPGFIKTNISLNALTASGEAQRKMDSAQENGMLPAVCAAKIIRAIELKEQEVLIGGKEKYGVLIKRFFPALFSKIMRNAKIT